MRRAQWCIVVGEYLPEKSSLYDVTMSEHHDRESIEASPFDSGTHSIRPTSLSRSARPIEGAHRRLQYSQSCALSPTSRASDIKRTSRPLSQQVPSVLPGQSSVGERLHSRTAHQADQLCAEEVRLAAEQRSVIPFFLYIFQKACQAERRVVHDLWRYLQFTAAGTRPLRLWKDCKRCCARRFIDAASSSMSTTADDEWSATSCLPGEGEGRWWELAHMGPDGLCGCPQTVESEAAELERRKGESTVAYRERMYLLALQRWVMGNDSRAMGDALLKVTEDAPEDFCALLLGTKFHFLAGERHDAIRICTRPNVIKALERCPFFWSLVAFAADQSALPRAVAETLSYRAARLAVALCPNDLSAHHALLHNFLVKGYFTDSLRLAQKFHPVWTRHRGFLQHHLWWHVAVVLLEMHQFRRAMHLFWTQVYPPERQEGWDSHNGAMQLLLRFKILHSWSTDFRTHQLLGISEAGDCRVVPQTDEVSKHKGQEMKVVGGLDSAAGSLERDLVLALRHVLLCIRLEEEMRGISGACGCSQARGEEARSPFSTVTSATPSVPATFLRGPSAGGLSIACYIAALALTVPEEGVGCSASAQTSTPACGKAGASDVGSVAPRVKSRGRQSCCYCGKTKPADEELRKLEEEVIPFLGWKARSYQGQIWLSAGKAFKAWADGDFATSAKLLEPLLRQNLAARAAREKDQHCQISVTQSERGNSTPQTQRELVEEAVFAAEDAEHKASYHRCGDEESSVAASMSFLEQLCASREQTDVLVLIFLDSFYRSRKSSLNKSPERISGAVTSALDNADEEQVKTTVIDILETKLATEGSTLVPFVHVYVCLCNSVCTMNEHHPTSIMAAKMHKKLACELIEKYAEEGILQEDRLPWA